MRPVPSHRCAAGHLAFLPFDGMGQLIVFRGVQGIGAGMITGVLFTIVGDIFSPQERGKYQGLFASIFGLASIFGPTFGGWLTDHWSWRACFYVNLPVGIIALLALHFEFPNMKPRPSDKRIDWAGFALLIATVVPLLLALTWVPQHGWGSLRVWPLLVCSAVMLGVFIANEAGAAEAIIPLSLFRSIIAVSALFVPVVAGYARRDLPAAGYAGARHMATQSGKPARRRAHC
jgi:MFS family permease